MVEKEEEEEAEIESDYITIIAIITITITITITGIIAIATALLLPLPATGNTAVDDPLRRKETLPRETEKLVSEESLQTESRRRLEIDLRAIVQRKEITTTAETFLRD